MQHYNNTCNAGKLTARFKQKIEGDQVWVFSMMLNWAPQDTHCCAPTPRPLLLTTELPHTHTWGNLVFPAPSSLINLGDVIWRRKCWYFQDTLIIYGRVNKTTWNFCYFRNMVNVLVFLNPAVLPLYPSLPKISWPEIIKVEINMNRESSVKLTGFQGF